MSVALAVLLYIQMATNGAMWVHGALVWGGRAATAICICAAILAIMSKSKWVMFISGSLLITCLLSTTLGSLGCAFLGGLSGGYARWSNCGQDDAVYIGLISFAFIFLALGRPSLKLLAISCVVVPLCFFGARWFYSQPLEHLIKTSDHGSECFFSTPDPYSSLSGKSAPTRILGAQNLQLGLAIGERSPRIFQVNERGAFIWKYSQRRFKRVKSSKLEQLCRESRRQGHVR